MFYSIISMVLVQLAGGMYGGGKMSNSSGNTYDLRHFSPLGYGSLGGVVMNLIKVLDIYIAPPITALVILIGAFQILTAAGNEDKLKTGWKTIAWAAIGYAILLSAWGIIFIIQELLGARTAPIRTPNPNYPVNI